MEQKYQTNKLYVIEDLSQDSFEYYICAGKLVPDASYTNAVINLKDVLGTEFSCEIKVMNYNNSKANRYSVAGKGSSYIRFIGTLDKYIKEKEVLYKRLEDCLRNIRELKREERNR